jgi:hypothetical protein
MPKVLTEIEKLDGRFSGVLSTVKGLFDRGDTAAEIPAVLHRMYGVTVTRKMVENHRYKRWVPEKECATLKAETTKAAIAAFGGDTGFDALVLAKLWELMDRMTIPQMLSARSLFLKIREQNLKEQEFLFKTGRLEPGQTADGEDSDPEAQQRKVLHRIKEIFGLAGDEPPAPPVRQLPAAGTGNA